MGIMVFSVQEKTEYNTRHAHDQTPMQVICGIVKWTRDRKMTGRCDSYTNAFLSTTVVFGRLACDGLVMVRVDFRDWRHATTAM